MRALRFVIYLTTLAYAAIIVTTGPSTEPSVLVPGVITSPILGATVGIIQVLASTTGLVAEFAPRFRYLTKWMFLILSSGFLYEVVLQLVVGRTVFDWLPYLVYSALCAVIYINEGLENEG